MYNLALALTTQADSPPPSPNSLALATLLRRVNLELGCSLKLCLFGLGLVQDGRVGSAICGARAVRLPLCGRCSQISYFNALATCSNRVPARSPVN